MKNQYSTTHNKQFTEVMAENFTNIEKECNMQVSEHMQAQIAMIRKEIS